MSAKHTLSMVLGLGLLFGAIGYQYTEMQLAENNGPLKNSYLFATPGDDIAVYVVENRRGQRDYYDADQGFDTLWLKVPKADLSDPLFASDIIRFYFYLMNTADPILQGSLAPRFTFLKYPLVISNFESLVIEEDVHAPLVADKPKQAPVGAIRLRDTRSDAGA